MNKPVRIALGLVVSAVCLWLVFKNISFQDVGKAVRDSQKIWFVGMFAGLVLSQVFRMLRWRELLSPIKRVPPLPLFIILTFGFFMNCVLPARAGEFIRAYALDREMGIPTSTALGSIALERLMDLAALLCVVTLAATVLPTDKIPAGKISAFIIIGLISATALFLFFKNKKSADGTRPRAVEWLVSFLQNLVQGFAVIKSPSKMAVVFGLSLCVWTMEIMNIMMVARAFSIPLPFTHASAVITGIAVGVMIPAAPGFIGTYEFFGQQPLIFLGHSATLSFSLIFVLHVFQLISHSLLGLPGLFKVGWGPRR